MTDWVQRHTAGVDWREFVPRYAGDDYTAAQAAWRSGLIIYEAPTRNWWVVSTERPPYALSDEPDPRWIAVG